MVHTNPEFETSNLILDFEFDQHLESHKHVINIIMGFRDMGCYRALPQQQRFTSGVAHPRTPPPPPSNTWSKPPRIFAWAARAFPHAPPTWSITPSPTRRTVSLSSAPTDCWPPLQTVHGGFCHHGRSRVVVATTSFQ
jgi:hypothetical protein